MLRHAAIALAAVSLLAACQGAPAASPTVAPVPTTAATPTPTEAATATPSPVPATPSPTATAAPTGTPELTPSPETTPSPSPELSPSPSPQEAAVELFLDDMTDSASGWGVAEGERGSISYVDGALQLTTAFDGAFVWSTRAVGSAWDVMRVEGLAVTEPGTSGYVGVMCVSDDQRTLGGLVTTDGGWVIMGIENDAVTVLEFDLEAGLEVGDDFMQLSLDCVNSGLGSTDLTLYLNGGPVASYEAADSIGPFTQAGVYAEADAEDYIAYFDGVRAVGAADATLLPPIVTADAEALLAHVPAEFAASCSEIAPSMFEPGAVAGVACTPDGSTADVVEYMQFDSKESMDAAYQQRVQNYAADVTGTTCSEGPSELGYDVGGEPAGRLFCAPQTVGIRLDWTDDRLNILSSAIDYDAGEDYGSLFEVWLAAGPNL